MLFRSIVYGYQTLDDRLHIAGVVLNRVGSDRHLAMLKAAIASLRLPVLGILRRDDAVTLPDRHLGLVPTDELADLPERFRHLATLGQRCFDWQALEKIWQPATDSPTTTIVETSQSHHPQRSSTRKIRIGIARDRAFNFYYEDNLKILTRLGTELVPFSPLTDDALPPDLSGLWLGGGFPEMFAAELSHNLPMRAAIAQQVAAGLPTYTECGGLMYLCESLVDFEGHVWPMVGALPTTTTMTGKLTLGYRQVTVQQTSPLVVPGQQFWGHEFHRSAIAPLPVEPLCTLSAYPLLDATAISVGTEGWGSTSIHASYVHLHWGAQPALPKRFIKRCDRDHS